MATLNREEQDRIGRVEQLRAWKASGERFVSDASLAEAELIASLALRNAEARERHEAERAAKIADQQARIKALHDERATKEQTAYMERRRLEFRGTEQQWQEMKGRILEEYLLGGGDDTEQRRLAQQVRL